MQISRNRPDLNKSTSFVLKSDCGNLYQEIQQWFQKFTLIQRLNKNQIRHVEISKILFHENKSWTFEDIDEIVWKYFENKSCQKVLNIDRTFTDKCISSPSRNTHLNDLIYVEMGKRSWNQSDDSS